MRLRRNKRLIGLDLGSSAVKAIELKRGWKGLRVVALGLQPVPRNSMVGGRVADASAVVEAVRLALGSRCSGRDVAIALPSNSVIVKRITLARSAGAQRARSIEAEIERHVQFDRRDVNVDYLVTGRDGETTGDEVDLLIVAARKDQVASRAAVVTNAGCNATVVDVDAFALHNTYEANYGGARGSVIALVDAGAAAIRLNVLSADRPIFTRDVAPGGHAFTEAVQKELNVPFEVAEQLKMATHDDASLQREAKSIVRAITERAIQDIATSVESLRTAETDRIDRILLTGGGSLLDGFLTLLRERVRIDVERFDPFRRVALPMAVDAPGPLALGSVDADSLKPLIGLAMGLALRDRGER